MRIHAIAYSPNDMRRPLLALGELSKRSLGTFRWVRSATTPDSWSAAFEQLRDEIDKQYVLTYFVDRRRRRRRQEAAHRHGRPHRGDVERAQGPRAPTCGGSACETGYCADDTCVQYRGERRPRRARLDPARSAASRVGALVVLGVIGFVMTKRSSRAMPDAAGHADAPARSRRRSADAGAMPHGAAARPAAERPADPGAAHHERAAHRRAPLLRNGFLIGKQPGCDLLIEDGYTSSQHAQIGMDAHGNCQLYDRGSTNGTFVNGVRITESALAARRHHQDRLDRAAVLGTMRTTR